MLFLTARNSETVLHIKFMQKRDKHDKLSKVNLNKLRLFDFYPVRNLQNNSAFSLRGFSESCLYVCVYLSLLASISHFVAWMASVARYIVIFAHFGNRQDHASMIKT